MQSGLLLCQWPSSCHIMSLKWPSFRNWVVFIWAIGRRLISRSGITLRSAFCPMCQTTHTSNITHMHAILNRSRTRFSSEAMRVRHIGWRPLQWSSSVYPVWNFNLWLRRNLRNGTTAVQEWNHCKKIIANMLRWSNCGQDGPRNVNLPQILGSIIYSPYIAVHHNTMLNPAQQGKIFG